MVWEMEILADVNALPLITCDLLQRAAIHIARLSLRKESEFKIRPSGRQPSGSQHQKGPTIGAPSRHFIYDSTQTHWPPNWNPQQWHFLPHLNRERQRGRPLNPFGPHVLSLQNKSDLMSAIEADNLYVAHPRISLKIRGWL